MTDENGELHLLRPNGYGRYLKRLKTLPSGSGRDAVPREFQNRLTKRRNKFACSKISASPSAMLFAAIFPPAQCVCNVDTSAVRNLMCATVSAIVCYRLRLYGNSALFDRLGSAICDSRSSAFAYDHK